MSALLDQYLFLVVIAIIAGVLAIAFTVVTFAVILPESKHEKLPGFFKWLADIFNFKSLLLEKILKFFYIFTTLLCIIMGFLMLFWFDSANLHGPRVWNGYWGFIIMIAGPIILRIIYEIIMLFIILVKNSEEIKKKLN